MINLETERLVVRNFRPEDWQDLHEYLSIEEVLRFEPGSVSSPEECKEMAAERSGGDIFLAAVLKDTGKMIGHIYFNQTGPQEFRTWELGYIFNPVYYGHGYATEASRRVMQHAFEELGAHRIIAMCNPDNASSWKLLERLGMRREGHLLQEAFFRSTDDGRPIWHDAYQYAILADEWATVKVGGNL
ncbi:GNAT family N-acetyltransferase [Paenibacillus sp. NFR01]|uniref:GNAT family N-acetyltransferase n=1 Tax=Paenibacillus sp. NFR01 TaxID=1566279 RepID=UPI0008C6F459|nr:GNAT family protein [Paenibacillus sp. NFR01]SEU19583.1 Protein N-acetyltransferase, RimJ/RimL family [Paenibacillus sp. NFR01]